MTDLLKAEEIKKALEAFAGLSESTWLQKLDGELVKKLNCPTERQKMTQVKLHSKCRHSWRRGEVKLQLPSPQRSLPQVIMPE